MMIYTLEAISTGKVEDLPYSTKRPMRSALNKKICRYVAIKDWIC